MAIMIQNLMILAIVLSILTFKIQGHGYMAIPVSRNVLHNGGSYGPGDIQSLDAGAAANERANGHGLCGDILPRNEFEAPNLNGPQFPTVATYISGQTIDIKIVITAHHFGWFEFRLCRNPDGGLNTSLPSTQSCLNQHVLQFDPISTSTLYAGKMRSGSGLQSPADYKGDSKFYSWEHTKCPYLPASPKGSCCNEGGSCSSPDNNSDRWVLPDPSLAGMTYNMRYKLPAGVTCPRCVLQWYYQTGNSVDGYPEGFWNCADITITPSNTPTYSATNKPSSSPAVVVPSVAPVASVSSKAPAVTVTSTAPIVLSSGASSAPISSTVFATCGASAWNCGSSSPYPLQQPIIPNCILSSGAHCCCSWGLNPIGNSCGCSSAPLTSAVPTSALSNKPISPSLKPSTGSAAPSTKSTSSKPSLTKSSSPTKKVTSLRPISSSPTKKVTSLRPISSSPTVKATTANPTVASTTSSSNLVTVTACGSNSFVCQAGSNDPVKQPVIPGFILSNNGGNCCCFWGNTPIPNSLTPSCSSNVIITPVILPTFAPSFTASPSTSYKPTTTNKPTVSSAPTATNPILYRGYYKWSWNTVGTAPAITNLGIAFSGHADPTNALLDSLPIFNALPGKKLLSIGGGNAAGMFTAVAITKLNNAIIAGKLAGYDGICYDIEEGDSGLASAFADSFAIAKKYNFIVFVTTSHSAPYGIADKVDLMNSFFPNPNIDILSPQLYTSGYEGANDYVWDGTPWSAYATAKAAIVPSIVSASMYADAQNFFATPSRSGTSFAIQGYVQWKQ